MSEGLHNSVIGVLASGGGTTFNATVRLAMETNAPVEFPVVICSKPPEEAGVYDVVTKLNEEFGLEIVTHYVGAKSHPEGKRGRGQTDQESDTICTFMDQHNVGLVACMGYMRIVRGSCLEVFGYNPKHDESIYQASMINNHPGILPWTADTTGDEASQKAIDLRLSNNAISWLLVDAGADTGPVIAETLVPIFLGDTRVTLNERVMAAERRDTLGVLLKFAAEQKEYFQHGNS